MSFHDLGLDPRLIDAVARLGYDDATSIQRDAIPPLLAGRDVIGRARTGSGKTAAFGLPLLHHLREGGPDVRGLVLTPTRELALQVTEALRALAKGLPIKVVTIYGGTAYEPQMRALRQGAAVVVATPGRLLDHHERKSLDLSKVEVLVLDEADEMLRMGFIDDVARVLKAAPPGRQVALFSASMPPAIQKVAEEQLRDPVEIQVEDKALTVDHIEQRGILVPHRHKLECLERVLRADPLGTHLVFVRTKKSCAEVADALAARGLAVDALHGDLNQAARERVLSRFRAGGLRVVIATDVAARGLDVDKITHVINYDFPGDAETYVHRIGRSGRAGAQGFATSFVSPSERSRMRSLERTLRVPVEPTEVPSDREIARGQRRALVDELRTTLETADLKSVRDWIASILADSKRTDADVAAAALYLLTQHTAGGFLDEGRDERPSWAKPQQAPAPSARGAFEKGPGPRSAGPGSPRRRGHDDADHVELFLAAGENKRVKVGDVVGALCHHAGLSSDDVGRIFIGERSTFIGMPPKAAKAVLQQLDHLPIRRMKVPLVLAAKPGAKKGPKPGAQKGPKPGPKPKTTAKTKTTTKTKKAPQAARPGPKKKPAKGGTRPPKRRR